MKKFKWKKKYMYTYTNLLIALQTNENAEKRHPEKPNYPYSKADIRQFENPCLSDFKGYPYFVYTFLYNKGLLKKEVSK